MLGDNPDIRENRQSIRIAEPAGDNMKMQVFFNAGTGNFAQVQPDVKSIGLHDLFKDIHRSLHCGQQLPHFLFAQLVQARNVPNRRHQKVTIDIRKLVHDHQGVRSLEQGQVIFFTQGVTENAAVFLFR